MSKEYFIDEKEIKDILKEMAQGGNKEFSVMLNPGVDHVLGIRLPELRQLAKRIAQGNWQDYLNQADVFFMEERMLYGMVLGYLHPIPEIATYLEWVTTFIARIRGWEVCDSFAFAGGRKYVAAHEKEIWPFLKACIQSDDEHAIRFGVVMALKYFADSCHAPEFFTLVDGIRHDAYYVRMGVAWALCEYYVKCPELTLAYLKGNNGLDPFTYSKTLQKITESLRVSSEQKDMIRNLRRKS